MKYSQAQIDIENEVKRGECNVAVEASPGAGKTTTLILCINSIKKTHRTIFLSFSKAIVEELRSRIPGHIKVSTLHGLGCGMVMSYYKGVKVDEDKYFKVAMSLFPHTDNFKLKKENFKNAFWIQDIVRFARMTLTPFTEQDLISMCGYYNLDFTKDVLTKSIKILNDIGKVKFTSIDFTDMLYLPIIKPFLIGEGYDRVLLDESQDTNDCQRAFIEWLLKPDARLISVGDSKQSIYSFAGANIDSFKNIQQRPNTKVFTLPVSHRCSKNVVKFAQGIYDTIQYSDYAIDGDVRLGSYLEIQEGDMVLSRTTLPLVYLFFLLVDRGVKASIIGKDIEVGLIEFAKKIKASSFEQVNKNMDNQLNELAKELKESGFIKPEKHNKYINLVEKIQVISLILNKIDNSLHLEDKIHQIFAENKKAARLMSIHRSKGLEEKRVFVIESFKGKQLIPSEYAVQEHEKIQERNLSFVAYTRAKEDILLLDI